jgi:hypothetical protein
LKKKKKKKVVDFVSKVSAQGAGYCLVWNDKKEGIAV